MNSLQGEIAELELALASDIGKLRERNEDAVAGSAQRRWALVADGMGGHSGGDIAAGIVKQELSARLDALMQVPQDALELERGLRTALEETNRAVYLYSLDDAELRGMGSTVVVACVCGSELVVAHVGDSRAYLFRGGRIDQLTHDHSLLQELLDGGMITRVEARRSSGRGVLTRSLGVDASVDVEVGHWPLREGDLVLLCSDGLTEMVDDASISTVLREPTPDLARLAERLVARANAQGGRDNVSVALMSMVWKRSA